LAVPTKVLVIYSRGGDGPTERERTLAVLREQGFEIAPEGEPSEHRPDVVLLDLPRSQRELRALLARAALAQAPLVVSSRDASTLPHRARALGAYGYVQKPFAPAMLCERLSSAAEARRQHPTLFGGLTDHRRAQP
jgi:DNA-binding NarL/FixJ family response regulator